MAVAEEAFANVRADEARAARDEKIHRQTLATAVRGVERAGEFSSHSRFIRFVSQNFPQAGVDAKELQKS
jgi:hypothetical protein